MVEAILTLPLLANFVAELTVTEGQGPLSLDGPPPVSPSSVETNATLVRFSSVFADGARVFYVIKQEGVTWEAGYGTLTHGTPDTLSRDFVTASLVSGEWTGGASLPAVDLESGQKLVYCQVPASHVALADRTPRQFVVDQVQENAALLSPAVGQRFLVYPPPGLGAFSGHDNEIAEAVTGGTYIFLQPMVGDLVIAEEGALFVGGHTFRWSGSSWRNLNSDRPFAGRVTSSQSISGRVLLLRGWMHEVLDGSLITITLPTAVSAQSAVVIFSNINASAAAVNVESGGTISGASSVNLNQWGRLQVQSVFNGTTYEWVQIN